MPRYRLTLEYDGTPYAGWQAQATRRAVQDAIEDALHAMTGERRRVLCAGRTDAGVHALAQVIAVDLSRDWPGERLRDGLNAHLKLRDEAVAVLEARAAPASFNPRTQAVRRRYRYRILNRRVPSPLEARRAWHVPRPLDLAAMADGAARLLGTHDFTTFRAAACQARSPVKTLDSLAVAREGAIVTVEAEARSFLHHQVRLMVGSLMRVGLGQWSPDDLAAALAARDPQRSGPQAPPWGLFFLGATYPEGDA